jgi:uncharacterized protein YjbI with pentapeptide repeats
MTGKLPPDRRESLGPSNHRRRIEPPAPQRPALAAKADDLEAIRTAAVDAAGISAGLWLSYLFVLFYLLVAAGGVTHRDLFLEYPIKLPFLNVELPLKGFFLLGPALFLVVHAYVLLHFVLLSSKAGVFDAQLRDQIGDAEVRTRLRRQLPINIFVQFLAGPREVRQGLMGFLLRLIAWISQVVGPVALLVFFEIQFLPYHDVWISWWQRTAVVIDLLLLWVLWPAVLHGGAARRGWRRIELGTGSVLACISLVSVLMVFAIATFHGEWLEVRLSWFPLRQMLVAGDVDITARKPTSLWSNRLVLPGLDVIDHAKFDSEAKIAAAPEMASLRGRHLEDAVLIGAVLRKVDFTGAQLQGASLDMAQLQNASLDRAQLQNASLDGAQLQNASLDKAQLQGASLHGAQLQNARLFGAQLQDVKLIDAQLQGAWLSGAQLQGASLSGAQLQGASLDRAQLQGASLDRAQLQGAWLDRAQLQGAWLDRAQLQGAWLDRAQLQGASLRHVFVWRTDVTHADTQEARIDAVNTGPKIACGSKLTDVCDWADTLDTVKRFFEREFPERRKATIVARLEQTLDPKKPLDGEEEIARRWIDLQDLSPAPNLYEKRLADLWRGLGCAPDGAPFVLTQLANYMSIPMKSDCKVDNVLSPFGCYSAQIPQLAADFFKQDCAGARGISNDTKALLTKLRDHVSQ